MTHKVARNLIFRMGFQETQPLCFYWKWTMNMKSCFTFYSDFSPGKCWIDAESPRWPATSMAPAWRSLRATLVPRPPPVLRSGSGVPADPPSSEIALRISTAGTGRECCEKYKQFRKSLSTRTSSYLWLRWFLLRTYALLTINIVLNFGIKYVENGMREPFH